MRDGYAHGEAFMLMQYESDDGTERLVIWNSRDGVTPFVVNHPQTKTELTHVRWQEDVRAPDHRPELGEYVWIDLTEERARDLAMRNAERWWDDPDYPARKQFPSIEAMAEMLAKSYLEGSGQPDLIRVDAAWLERFDEARAVT